MPNRYFAADVLKYLEKNVRLNVYASDIASDLGLTRKQVINCVYNLKKNGEPIAVVAQGVWRYDPSSVKAEEKKNGADHMLFELVGQSKQGKFVLQDEAGDLYVAERL